jgi:hypothetical protein
VDALNRNPLRAALLSYLGMALLLTWPMPLHPIDTVPGHPKASVGCHLWVLWWAQRDMSDLHSDLLFHPYGADVVQLYGSDLLSPLLLGVLPLPPSLLYNFWILFLLVFSGFGTFLLGRQLGFSLGGALVSGTVMLAAPFFQHELFNGTSELLAAGFLPWYALLLTRVLESPSPRRGLELGALTGLAVLASVYNAFFILLITLCFLVHRLGRDAAPIFHREMRQALLRAFLGGAPSLAFLGWLHLRHGAAETLNRREMRLSRESLPDSYADLLDWFDPSAVQVPVKLSLLNGEIFDYWTTCTVFLGFVPMGLAIFCWYRNRKEKEDSPARSQSMAPYVLMLFSAALIALGPYLRIGGEEVRIMGHPIAMPMMTLVYLFPPMALTALHAYRYAAVAILGLSVLAGRTLRSPWWAGVVLVETLLFSPVPLGTTTAIPRSSVIERLSELPAGAVLFAPLARENLHDISRALLSQTIHGKPIQDGGIHRRTSKDSLQLFVDNPLVYAMGGRSGPDLIPLIEGAKGLAMLREQGYSYVLVPSAEEPVVDYFISLLGPTELRDERWTLWTM